MDSITRAMTGRPSMARITVAIPWLRRSRSGFRWRVSFVDADNRAGYVGILPRLSGSPCRSSRVGAVGSSPVHLRAPSLRCGCRPSPSDMAALPLPLSVPSGSAKAPSGCGRRSLWRCSSDPERIARSGAMTRLSPRRAAWLSVSSRGRLWSRNVVCRAAAPRR